MTSDGVKHCSYAFLKKRNQTKNRKTAKQETICRMGKMGSHIPKISLNASFSLRFKSNALDIKLLDFRSCHYSSVIIITPLHSILTQIKKSK